MDAVSCRHNQRPQSKSQYGPVSASDPTMLTQIALRRHKAFPIRSGDVLLRLRLHTTRRRPKQSSPSRMRLPFPVCLLTAKWRAVITIMSQYIEVAYTQPSDGQDSGLKVQEGHYIPCRTYLQHQFITSHPTRSKASYPRPILYATASPTMHLTILLTLLATSALAVPAAKKHTSSSGAATTPASVVVTDKNSCGNNATPYCCSTDARGSFVQCALIGAGASCYQSIVCCSDTGSDVSDVERRGEGEVF